MAYLKSLSVHVQRRNNKNNKETATQFYSVPTMEHYTVD